MSIADRLIKPTAEFLSHLAGKIPGALGKGHHRIAEHVHNAANRFDKTEADLAAKTHSLPHGDGDPGHEPHGVQGPHDDPAHVPSADEPGDHGIRPHDGDKQSIPGSEKNCKTDPVDVATGDMVMPNTDVELPGALPLVLERTHISSYRHGIWFGPTWASTLDQRLQLDSDGVVFTSADGMCLEYPPPSADSEVLPLKGPRRPLTWSGVPNDPMRVTDPKTGETLVFDHPRPAPDAPGAVILRLSAIEDRNDRRIDITWAEDDSPALITHHGGYRIAVDRHPDLPRITALRLLDTEGPGTETTLIRYGYDPAGDLVEIYNSSGLPLRLRYDAHHRVTGWTDRNGTDYAYVYDTAGRVIRTEGTAGFLSSTFSYDDATHTTTFTNSLGHSWTYQHNDAYRLIRETDPLGNATVQEWDQANDHITATTDPLGHTTHYTYDGDRLAAFTFPDATLISAVHSPLGLPATVTESDGAVWRREYDERGNLTGVTDPSGAITRYGYDTRGHLTTVINALGAVTTVRCNAAGLPVSVRDPLGAMTRHEQDAFGRVVAVIDPVGATDRLEWTTEGKPARRIAADGATETWTYDGEGNCVTHTDAIGGVTAFEYTCFDLPAARTDPDGTRYEFTHDTELRFTGVANPQGMTWTYTYDPAGRLTAETDFDGRTLTYTRDPAGRLTSRTDTLGRTITLERDAAGQVVRKQAGDRTTTFTYDPAGRLMAATNPDAEVVYQRDLLGRVVSETADGRLLSFAYDAKGQRVRRTTPSGVTTTYAYNPAGRRTALTTAGRTLDFTHDPAGREVARSIGNALTLTSAWDPAGRLIEQLLTVDPGGVVQHRAYTYRADGHLTGIDDHLSGPRTFDLDQTGRVTAVDARDWSETYAYDAAGNQTHATWPTSHPEADATGPRTYTGTRITHAGNTRYEHDAAGRITLRQKARLSRKPDTWRYTWDAEDHLTSVTTPDGTTWRYLYDALGRRTSKQRLTVDGRVAEEVRFTWDGPTLIEQTTTGTAPNPATLTWDHDGLRPLTQTEHTTDAATQSEIDRRFFGIVTDLVGTPTELLDDTGTPVWRAHTTLWGTTTWPTTSTAYTPLRFPGQYADPETGLHYNVFRHYDPETAGYASPDPLGLASGAGPTSYVPNPHTSSDPLGLWGCDSPDPVEITVRWMPGMPKCQFWVKAMQLKELSDLEALFRRPSPVRPKNTINTGNYKDKLIKRIYAQYGSSNPDLAKSLTQRVKGMQVDHVWEFQVGGPDDESNFHILDAFVNWHVGTQQIWPQIASLPDYTPITIRIVGPP